MCFDFDSRPPDLPSGTARIRGGAAAESMVLTAADGTRLAAALADSGEQGTCGVVVLPDVRGLYRFYIELAERLAEAGHPSIAIDYFGRTAGVGERGEDFDYRSHIPRTSAKQVSLDIAAAREALAERTGATAFATLGFCFGGSHSFFAATDPELGLDGAVGFYGLLEPRRVDRHERPSLLEHGAKARVPVLGLFGGDDRTIPREDVDAFERALEAAGVRHELVVYPDAPHSFFDRAAAEHAEASADAWRRVLDFLAGLRREG